MVCSKKKIKRANIFRKGKKSPLERARDFKDS